MGVSLINPPLVKFKPFVLFLVKGIFVLPRILVRGTFWKVMHTHGYKILSRESSLGSSASH